MTLEAGVTDENGHYTWTLTPGDYDITVSSPNHPTATKTVTVTTGELVRLDFVLSP
jgi:hypothetical protein